MVGIASCDRFAGSPRGHAPDELLPGARSVIVAGVRLLPAIVNWPDLLDGSELMQGDVQRLVAQNHVYMRAGYHVVNAKLEQIALETALMLEEAGYPSLYFPATYGDHAPIMEQVPGLYAPFSHRHAAVRAGLGEFGMNNLVLTPRFGPRVRFISVITAADLEPDPLLSRKLCVGAACAKCVEGCLTGALRAVGYDANAAALGIGNPVDKELCYRRHGESGCIGACLRECPVGR